MRNLGSSGSGSTSATTGSASGSTSATTGSGLGLDLGHHRLRLGLDLGHHRLRLGLHFGHHRLRLDELERGILVPGDDPQGEAYRLELDLCGNRLRLSLGGDGLLELGDGRLGLERGRHRLRLGLELGQDRLGLDVGDEWLGLRFGEGALRLGNDRLRLQFSERRLGFEFGRDGCLRGSVAVRELGYRPAFDALSVATDSGRGREVGRRPRFQLQAARVRRLSDRLPAGGRGGGHGGGQPLGEVVGAGDRHAASTATGIVVPAVHAGVLAAVDAEVERLVECLELRRGEAVLLAAHGVADGIRQGILAGQVVAAGRRRSPWSCAADSGGWAR